MKIKLEIDPINRAVKQYKKLKKEHQKEILSIIDDLLDDIVKMQKLMRIIFKQGKSTLKREKDSQKN